MLAGVTPRGSTKGREHLRIGMTSHHRIGCISLDLHYKNHHFSVSRQSMCKQIFFCSTFPLWEEKRNGSSVKKVSVYGKVPPRSNFHYLGVDMYQSNS